MPNAFMPEYPKLKSTPIKEIIFNVSYSENIKQDDLAKFCSLPGVASEFRDVKQGFAANIKADTNKKITTRFSSEGYILKSETHVIQVKVGSFAFHKVNEYEPFETLFDKLNLYWNNYLKVVGNLTVNNVSLRYLNFIEVGEGENVDSLINVKVDHPYEYEIKNKLLQLHFTNVDMPDLNINVVITKGKDGTRNGLILDIFLNHAIKQDQTNYQVIFDKFNLLREVKNNIFFKTLTEYTLNKYYGN